MKIKLFYLALTLFFIFSWFKLVDFGKTTEAIVGVKWYMILIAVGLGLVRSLLGAVRLKTLLSVLGNVSFGYILGMGYLAALITLIFPFSLGGFSLAYVISQKTKSSYKKSFSVVFIDFFIGILITLMLSILGIFYFSRKKLLSFAPEFYSLSVLLAAGILSGILLILVLFIFRSKLKLLDNFFVLIMKALTLFNFKIVITVIFLTGMMFFLGVVSQYLYYLAFEMKPKILDFILAGSLFGVLGMIPGAPAKVGQYETFGILTLPYLLNLDKNTVFAMLLVQHAIEITTVLLIGAAAIYFLKLNPWQIKQSWSEK